MNTKLKQLALMAKVQDAFEQSGMNRKEFGARMSITPTMITNWFSGKVTNLELNTLFRLEKVLNTSLIDLSEHKKTT